MKATDYPPCHSRCTLERGGTNCEFCSMTTRERYSWHMLPEAEREQVLKRVSNHIAQKEGHK